MLDEHLLRELRTVNEHTEYYALTMLADEHGDPYLSTSSIWVGFTDQKPRREIRQASLVKPHIMTERWNDSGQPHIVVNSLASLAVFYAIGGNALLARDVMEREFGGLCAPYEVAYAGPLGFKGVERLPPAVFARAPRPKARMRILKRDDYRCRLCGRRAADYTDIELHVHHIRPWSRGGLTDDDNLITLCSTCHDGLEPHHELSLYDVIQPGVFSKTKEQTLSEHLEGVARYRSYIEKARQAALGSGA
jgi:hypothetical protein